jgi:hypothetical protein
MVVSFYKKEIKMKVKIIIMSILMLILTFSISAQERRYFGHVPIQTDGFAYWDVSPPMNQLFGQAGQGTNEVRLILQGYSGVAWLSAPVIQFYGQFVLNNKYVTEGAPDSGGKGYRVLVVPN